MTDTIHVAACCDENYVAYANVMMLSSIAATASKRIHFHLIDCGISSQGIERLKGSVEGKGAILSVYQPNDALFEGLPTHRYGSAVYQRIILPEYIPADIQRILYIDSDTLVRADLGQLWNTDLQGNPVAAVENLSPKACRDIGIPRTEYFNSGVLLLDLGMWRTEGIHWQVTEYARQHAHQLQFVDQCSLNAILHRRWVRLPAYWNQQSDIYKVIVKYYDGCTYTQQELEQAILNPGIVHFTGKKKPWTLHCFHPFKTDYRQLLAQTSWPGFSAQDNTLKTRLRYYLALRKHWKHWRRVKALSKHAKHAKHKKAPQAKREKVTPGYDSK